MVYEVSTIQRSSYVHVQYTYVSGRRKKAWYREVSAIGELSRTVPQYKYSNTEFAWLCLTMVAIAIAHYHNNSYHEYTEQPTPSTQAHTYTPQHTCPEEQTSIRYAEKIYIRGSPVGVLQMTIRDDKGLITRCETSFLLRSELFNFLKCYSHWR